ncbi:uncharacterized protein [Dermacentor albipictus]|uniref:uncharacterized protein n=1 Tax=Dermacentor albipictus TaxID=60249 RepID=UPI0038FD2C09
MLKDEREYVLLTDHLNTGVVSSHNLAEMTARDGTLMAVMRYLREGWPRKLPATQEALRPMFQKKDELTCSHGALPRRHSPGQPVWCKDYRAGASWRPGVIQNTRGARPSTVKTEDGELCERHEDQLRHRADAQQPTSLDEEGAERNGGLAPPNEDADPLAGFSGTSPNSSASEEHETAAANTGVPEEHDTGAANAGPLAVPIRRSNRRRKAPDRFQSSS